MAAIKGMRQKKQTFFFHVEAHGWTWRRIHLVFVFYFFSPTREVLLGASARGPGDGFIFRRPINGSQLCPGRYVLHLIYFYFYFISILQTHYQIVIELHDSGGCGLKNKNIQECTRLIAAQFWRL
jgi:hypothetical protein